MAVDGVSAEVLYATFGLRLFALEDAELQEACFQIANDWMMEYCKGAPGRLFGIPNISMYKHSQRDQRTRSAAKRTA
jgi:predicted TIM-barrel fold metal-dependent hydrolase